MGKRRLKMLQPTAARLGPRVAVASGADRDKVRARMYPSRKWYNQAKWKRLRRAVLLRDGWTCRQTGVLLTDRPNLPNSAVVDHVLPHRGDPERFWDIGNLQAVAKEWHDGEKQRRERSGEA